MTRILLTGGSGFIAAHVLEVLLKRGHSVVTTVRSSQKGNRILDAHRDHTKATLDYVVVEDISISNGKPLSHRVNVLLATDTIVIAFQKAVVSDPPFDAVVHTASPYHFKSQDNKKELLDPGESPY